MLPVAYHNLAVEYEHLGLYEEAMEAYLKATDVARRRLGAKDALTVKMEAALDAARKVAKAAAHKPAPKTETPRPKTHRHEPRSSTAPWTKNKSATPRLRHQAPVHTAPYAAQAYCKQGGAPPTGRVGDSYQSSHGRRRPRPRGPQTVDDVLGSLPPIDAASTVDIASYRTSRSFEEQSIPLGRQRAAWERLPWNHVQVEGLEIAENDEFMPPPSAQQRVSDIYGGAQSPRDKSAPRPPPKLPPGVLYRPKRSQRGAQG